MSAVVKKVVDLPKKAINDTSKTLKQASKPANEHDSRMVALGTILSAPVSVCYSKLWDLAISKLPFMNNQIVNTGAKVVVPFGIAVLVKKTKLPFGNVVNGVLYGVGIAQVIRELWNLVGGKLPSMPSLKIADNKVIPISESKELDVYDFAEW